MAFLSAYSGFLLVMVPLSGAFASDWLVTYNQLHICAVEGSSLDMSCNYTFPQHLTLERAFWTIKEAFFAPDLVQDQNYRGRITVDCGNPNRGRCTLKIKEVKRRDAVKYYCRITTDSYWEKWLGRPGATLYITDLQVDGAHSTREGDHVTFTCVNSCPWQSKPSFTWSKDGRPVEKKQIINNQLQLHPVSYRDEGSYTCAFRGHEDHPSPGFMLNVDYKPRNTLVSISPSNQTLEGATVSLTCSSDANPPVENYTWFKVGESTPVGSGQQYNITNIRSEDGGQYYCEARNTMGANKSSPRQINVIAQSRDMQLYIPVGIATACGVVIVLCVAVLCISRCQKGHKNITGKEKDEEEDQYTNTGFQRSSHAGIRDSPEDQGAEVHYANLQPKDRRQTSAAPAQGDDVQYASVQFKKVTFTEESPAQADPDDLVIYSGVQFQHPSQHSGFSQADREDSVIYSGVQS